MMVSYVTNEVIHYILKLHPQKGTPHSVFLFHIMHVLDSSKQWLQICIGVSYKYIRCFNCSDNKTFPNICIRDIWRGSSKKTKVVGAYSVSTESQGSRGTNYWASMNRVSARMSATPASILNQATPPSHRTVIFEHINDHDSLMWCFCQREFTERTTQYWV